MTHPAITRLRELSEKATAPPWRERYIRFSIADSNLADDNDNFIAESRNALPVLLDCLEKALEGLDRLGSSEAFLFPKTTNDEERLRLQYARDAQQVITAKLDTLKGETTP